jgi:hypothetical protein
MPFNARARETLVSVGRGEEAIVVVRIYGVVIVTTRRRDDKDRRYLLDSH